MKIMLVKNRDFGWTIVCGDHSENKLGEDEALFVVAQLLILGDAAKARYLKTKVEREKIEGEKQKTIPHSW